MSVRVGLWVRVVAKQGREEDVATFLASALPLAEAERSTTAWFAVRISRLEFGIFDVFPSSEGRDVHLAGPIAQALMGKADELLAQPPSIEKLDVLAAKLTG